MLELRHLKHLAAIADEGGLEKAAEKLGLTQPALTKSMRRMEELLGVPLFERAGRRLALTAIGADILADGRRLIRDADDVERRARLWAEGAAGRVTVGVGPAVQAGFVPEVLTRLARERIEGNVLIETGHADNLLPRLMAGALDFAVYDFPVDPHDPDLSAKTLNPDPIMAMMRAGHPLVAAGKIADGAALAPYPLGTVPAPPGLRDVTALLSVQMGGRASMTLECDTYVSHLAAAKESDLVVLIPGRAAARLMTPDFAILPLAFLNATTTPRIIRRRHRPQSPLARRVMKLFEEVVG